MFSKKINQNLKFMAEWWKGQIFGILFQSVFTGFSNFWEKNNLVNKCSEHSKIKTAEAKKSDYENHMLLQSLQFYELLI